MAGSTTTKRRRKPVNADYLKKEPTEVHAGFAAYIAETTGQEVPVETVGLVQRLYPLYLKSPAVVKAREEAQRKREEEQAAKEERKKARAKARLARIEEERRRVLAELGIEDTDAEVIEAADRFEQPTEEPDEDPTEDSEEEPEEDDSEPEEEDSSDSDEDDDDQSEEATLADDDEDDDWGDDEDDEDDEEDF